MDVWNLNDENLDWFFALFDKDLSEIFKNLRDDEIDYQNISSFNQDLDLL